MDIFRQPMAAALSLLVIVVTLTACTRGPSGEDRRQVALISLGEKLFSDKGLSRDGTVSCASCHDPGQFFADGKPVPTGVDHRSGTRNAPSLLDVGLVSSFFWDGRVTRLEDVVIQPLTNPVEMGLSDQDAILRRLERNPSYATLSQAAFDRDALDVGGVGTALAAYLRSLPRHQSRYDRYVVSGHRTGLSENERQGLSLFQGKAACAECHRLQGVPALLTDNAYHHTGIGFDRVAGNISLMLGKLDRTRQAGAPLGTVLLSDPELAELGRFAVTRRPGDLGAFRTPSLRNVAQTAPYMHDGSVPTLQAAVEREIYYRSLARGRSINLTVEEQQQLIAFLGALTSTPADAPP